MGLPVLPFFIHLLMLTSTQEPHFLIGFIFDDFVIEANSVLTGAVCFFARTPAALLAVRVLLVGRVCERKELILPVGGNVSGCSSNFSDWLGLDF